MAPASRLRDRHRCYGDIVLVRDFLVETVTSAFGVDQEGRIEEQPGHVRSSASSRQRTSSRAVVDRLDELLPEVRTAQGQAAAADFRLHEMPNVIERPAVDFESATIPSKWEPGVRVLSAARLLVPYFGACAAIVEDGSVEIFWLDIE